MPSALALAAAQAAGPSAAGGVTGVFTLGKLVVGVIVLLALLKPSRRMLLPPPPPPSPPSLQRTLGSHAHWGDSGSVALIAEAHLLSPPAAAAGDKESLRGGVTPPDAGQSHDCR